MSSISIKPAASFDRTAINPWIIAARGRRADVHGDLGHDDRERGPAVHRRRPVRCPDRCRLGHHQLPGRQRHRPADHRLAVCATLAGATTSCICIAVFTLASALCGFATSLTQMIVFRIIQGLAGGGLQPCSQGVLLDAFPEEEQGTAMTLFGVAAILGPIVGPHARRLALRQLRLAIHLPDQRPDRRVLADRRVSGGRGSRVPQARAGRAQPPAAELRLHRTGTSGAGHVAAGKSCSARDRNGIGSAIRSAGCRHCSFLFVLGLALLIYQEMRTASPIINFRVLRDRNLSLSCIIMFCAFAVLYCSCIALPVAAPVPVRLRRASFGNDDVALGRLLHGGDDRRRGAAGSASRRPLVGRERIGRHGHRQLQPFADES